MKKILIRNTPGFSLVLIALLFRLPQLNSSFWMTEATQALASQISFYEQFVVGQSIQPPFFFLVSHLAQLISHQEWWLRLIVALIPGLITVFFTYKIGEKLHSSLTGSLAALFLATSSLHIYFSQELRPHSLAAMLALVTWYLLVEKKIGTDTRRYILFGILSVLGVYTTYFYTYLMIGQLIYVYLTDKKVFQKVLMVFGISVLAFMSQIPIMLKQLEYLRTIRQELPSIEEVIVLPSQSFLPFLIGTFVYGIMEFDFNPMQSFPGILIIAIAAMLTAINYTSMKKETIRMLKFSASSFIIPVFVLLLISLFLPVIQPRGVLFLLPVFYLYLSSITTPYFSQTIGNLRGGLAVLVILTMALINIRGTVEYNITPELQRENWRQLYFRIANKYPGDNAALVFKLPETPAAIKWYDKNSEYKVVTLENLHVDYVPDLEQRLSQISDYDTVLVFSYFEYLTDPEDKVGHTIEDLGYRNSGKFFQPIIGDVRIYTR